MISLQPFSSPDSIEKESFAIIDAEVADPKPFSGAAWEIARRMVHSCADFEILNHLYLADSAIAAGIQALRDSCIIYTDTEMSKVGMSRFRLDPLGVKVLSVLSLPGVEARAKESNGTRAKAGIELAWERTQALDGNKNTIWVIGNAPTALLRLLELAQLAHNNKIEPKLILPRLIIGLPVGFVNAAESKECLLAQNIVPFLTLRGRKGGSTLAAATVNALAKLALAE